jgi:hypothetical protein
MCGLRGFRVNDTCIGVVDLDLGQRSRECGLVGGPLPGGLMRVFKPSRKVRNTNEAAIWMDISKVYDNEASVCPVLILF